VSSVEPDASYYTSHQCQHVGGCFKRALKTSLFQWVGVFLQMTAPLRYYSEDSEELFSTSWRRSCIGHWTALHHPIWLQTSDGCLTCRPGHVCCHRWSISWTSASRSVQLLETERLLLPVLGCGTVCQLTLFLVTHFLISVENLKHLCLGSPILLFCLLRLGSARPINRDGTMTTNTKTVRALLTAVVVETRITSSHRSRVLTAA